MRQWKLLICLVTLALGAGLSAQPRVSTLGPYGGDVRSLAIHPDRPDRVFLGTADGQIFLSNNAGQEWKKLVPGLNRRNLVVDNLAFDPSDANTLYAATWELKSSSGWLFRTRDGGRSWEDISLGRHQRAIRAIAIAASNPEVIALGITDGVILSLDGGRTWERITRGYRSLYNVESLAFDPFDADTLYVGTWRLGWKTIDGGKKWKAIHKGMIFDSDMFSLVVDPLNPEILYSSACTGVYKSENRGSSWTKLKKGLPKQARRTRTLHLDPSDPKKVYAGTTVGLFTSDNGGQSWRQLFSDVVVNTVVVHPENGEIVLAGTDDAGVLRSDDGGLTFQASNSGFIHRQIPAIAADTRRAGVYYATVSADGRFGGFFISQDHGLHWESHNDGLGEAVSEIKQILPSNSNTSIFLATTQGLFTGSLGEQPWSLLEETASLAILDVVFGDTRENKLFLATLEGIFQFDLTGQSLRQLMIPEYQGRVNTVLYDPVSRRLLAGTEMGLFTSDDGGQTWKSRIKGLPRSPVNVLTSSKTRLFCGTRVGLFFSEDGGKNWSQCEGVYPIDIAAVQANPFNPGQVVAADSVANHLFHSADGGIRWEIINLGTQRSTIASLTFGPLGELLAGTLSEGVYRIEQARSIPANDQ